MCLTNGIDSFEINDDFSISEIYISEKHIGKTIREIQMRRNYNILALTTIKKTEIKSLVSKIHNEDRVQTVVSPDTILEKNGILVIYGSNKDLKNFANQ